MAVLSDYTSGTISLANGSVTVTGTGTLFEVTRFEEGDTLQIQNLTAVIASVDSDTQLTLAEPWTGTTIVDGPYRARQLGDGSRVSTQAATVIELLGNGVLTNLAELGVEEGKTPVGGPTGEYELVDTSTFGIQDPNGSLGNLAALTLAANKAITTDGSGNAQQSDLGTLGRALLALATGTNAQYVQGDGTLQAKSGLPISTETQTALNAKANLSGASFTGSVTALSEITSASTRTTTTPGQINGGGSFTSGFTDATFYSRLVTQEVVGSTVRCVLAVYLDAGNQAFFLFGSNGSLAVPGALSKGSGTFDIDHPLDPFNKNLVHGFVESTEYMNLYRGMVDLEDGRMIVDIDAAFGMTDGTFEALNADVMVTALQAQYVPEHLYVEASPASGKFVIRSENPNSTATVAWMVSGRRQDAFIKNNHEAHTDADGRLVPEYEKEDV